MKVHVQLWILYIQFWKVEHYLIKKNSSNLFTLQATGVRDEQLLVTVLPGLPTTAEFFLLPDKQLTEGKPEKSSAHLDQVRSQVLLRLILYLLINKITIVSA